MAADLPVRSPGDREALGRDPEPGVEQLGGAGRLVAADDRADRGRRRPGRRAPPGVRRPHREACGAQHGVLDEVDQIGGDAPRAARAWACAPGSRSRPRHGGDRWRAARGRARAGRRRGPRGPRRGSSAPRACARRTAVRRGRRSPRARPGRASSDAQDGLGHPPRRGRRLQRLDGPVGEPGEDGVEQLADDGGRRARSRCRGPGPPASPPRRARARGGAPARTGWPAPPRARRARAGGAARSTRTGGAAPAGAPPPGRSSRGLVIHGPGGSRPAITVSTRARQARAGAHGAATCRAAPNRS